MTTATHGFALAIDAAPAKRGAAEFTAAITAIKKAVKDLARETDGTFSQLRKSVAGAKVPGAGSGGDTSAQTAALKSLATSANASGDAMKRASLQAAAALRVSTGEAARLQAKLSALGDDSGVELLNRELERLRANLASAGTGLDVRGARSGFADTAADLKLRVAELQRVADAEAEAARGEASRASGLASLRGSIDPLYASSMRYASALEQLDASLKRGAISQAEHTRLVAAAGVTYLSTADDMAVAASRSGAFGGALGGLGKMTSQTREQIRNASYQISDFAVQLGSGQSASMALGQQLPQLLAGFGPLGAVVGTLAAVGIPALAYAFASAGEEVLSFDEAVKNTDQSLQKLSQSASVYTIAGLEALKQKYGEVDGALLSHIERMRQANAAAAMGDVKTQVEAFASEFGGFFTSVNNGIADAFKITTNQAGQLQIIMDRIKNARTFEESLAATVQLRGTIESMTGGLDNMSASGQEFFNKLVLSEDQLRQLARVDQSWLSALVSGAGDVASNLWDAVRAKAALSTQDLEARVGPDERGSQRLQEFSAGDYRRNKAAEAARKLARSSGGGGGGGSSELSAVQQLNKDLDEELAKLKALEAQHKALGSSTFKSEEAAKLYGEAVAAMGGKVDSATMAMLRQIDAQAAAAAKAAQLAKRPIQEWMDSVPSWIEASNTIQTQALEGLSSSLSEFFQTGKFNLASFAQSMVKVFADLLADQTIKAFFNMMDGLGTGTGGSGGGGILGALVSGIGAIFSAGSEGGYSGSLPGSQFVPFSAFAGAPHYAEGTGNTSGIPAVLHPNEAVIPLSRGRKVPVELGGGGRGGDVNVALQTSVTIQARDGADGAEMGADAAKAINESIELKVRDVLAKEMRYGGMISPR